MRATKIYPGMWEVLELGKYYRYRVYLASKLCKAKWRVYKTPRNAEGVIPFWNIVTSGHRAKSTAVEYAVEEAGRDDQIGGRVDRSGSEKNPVADLINNIDDNIDLNNEGWDH